MPILLQVLAHNYRTSASVGFNWSEATENTIALLCTAENTLTLTRWTYDF